MDYSDSFEGNTIRLNLFGAFTGETTWFILRTHGEEPEVVEGASIVNIEEDAYLIAANQQEVTLKLKIKELYYRFRTESRKESRMKVCIVAEGCYPYVVGGVSSWIHSMIRSFPNLEFQILAIISNRSLSGKFAYELPENVTQVHEVYLEDFDWDGAGGKGREIHLTKKE